MPAVSTKRSGPSSVSITVSIESRVVPGSSCTTARSSPTRRLNSVDFPTFGRPTIAIENGPPSSSGSASVATGGGNAATTASSRSPLPRPCNADTTWGSPRPSCVNAQASLSREPSSTLLTTTTAGGPARRRSDATRASSSVMPTVTSTTRTITSAWATARSACRLTSWSRSPPPASQPPVSTTRK